MHNAAYAALGLDGAYVAFHVTPDGLADAIRAIPALGILGVNLTVPHKEAAVSMVSALSDEAEILGAANCLVNRDGRLIADNTDAQGLESDMRSLRVRLADKSAIIIGAGGAAAAALLACARMEASEVILANRTRSRAEALADRFRSVEEIEIPAIAVRGLDALTDPGLVSDVSLVVNATSMGLTTPEFVELDYDSTPDSCFFYDTVYSAKPTAFLRPAIDLDRRYADGAGMLVRQGELAFELFNGKTPPRGVMRQALMTSLGRRETASAENRPRRAPSGPKAQ